MPRSTASMRNPRIECGLMIRLTDPTSTARSTLWMASNRSANAPRSWARTSFQARLRSARSCCRSDPSAAPIRSSSAVIRSFSRAAFSTSRANTTAAAGPPPMTEARVPSSAIVSRLGLSFCENTTNAPPW